MSTSGIGSSLSQRGLQPDELGRGGPSVIPSASPEGRRRLEQAAEEESLVALRALAGQKPPMGKERPQMEEPKAAQQNPNPAPTASSPRPGPAMTSQGALFNLAQMAPIFPVAAGWAR